MCVRRLVRSVPAGIGSGERGASPPVSDRRFRVSGGVSPLLDWGSSTWDERVSP